MDLGAYNRARDPYEEPELLPSESDWAELNAELEDEVQELDSLIVQMWDSNRWVEAS